jgi:hypothetical protein
VFEPKALKRIWWSDVLIHHKVLPYFPQCATQSDIGGLSARRSEVDEYGRY